MAFRASLAQIVAILQPSQVTLPEPERLAVATGLSTDTRQIQAGQVFVALRGETFDGHAFVAQAIAQGAIAALVAEDAELPADLPLIRVPDTLVAYQALGHWWRQQFAIPVVAVTGSVGKTTTKELIAAVLGQHGPVLKTQANYNNEIGVPKTLLELGPEHRFAVIEMGMRGPGEIALLCQIASPTVGMITNVGTAHIGRLGSEDAIARAKCELLAEMPAESVAVLNGDNARLMRTANTVWSGRTLSYGLENGNFQGTVLPDGSLQVGDRLLPLPLSGEHNALNYLGAIGVAEVLGLDWSGLQAGLAVELPGGRAQRHELAPDVVILDETYNAGLESMLASLRLLAQTPGTRRLAVLGTMKELGERSPEFHHQVGQAVQNLGLDGLLILADPPEAAALASGAEPLVAEQFADHAALVARLQALIQPGDRLLFKASRAVGLDRVVAELMDRWPAQS